VLKHLVACSLTCTSGSHKHDTKTHVECLEQLDGFQDEGAVALQLMVIDGLLDLHEQLTVVRVRDFNCGEQILNDGREQG
jgi:hypothetical protein